jgi:type IV secretion system protein VirD4
MQLPPADELVLVSGLAPIRAKKLRYYEDANFKARVKAAPALSDGIYHDRPPQRPDDWCGRVRLADPCLVPTTMAEGSSEDAGGLQQQRQPDLPDHIAEVVTATPEIADDENETSDGIETFRPSAIRTAFGVNGGGLRHRIDDDVVPAF